MSLKPENLFTTLRLGLQLWTLRDDYIILSTGQPLQIQRPKQWTKPVTLRERKRRKQMSDFFMIAAKMRHVIL